MQATTLAMIMSCWFTTDWAAGLVLIQFRAAGGTFDHVNFWLAIFDGQLSGIREYLSIFIYLQFTPLDSQPNTQYTPQLKSRREA